MTAAILDIHNTNLWRFGWTPNGMYPFVLTEVEKWWRDHIEKDHVRMIAREVQIHDRDGVRNSYRVFLLFKDEPSLVHFRLRWGGKPVEEMPANRYTVYE